MCQRPCPPPTTRHPLPATSQVVHAARAAAQPITPISVSKVQNINDVQRSCGWEIGEYRLRSEPGDDRNALRSEPERRAVRSAERFYLDFSHSSLATRHWPTATHRPVSRTTRNCRGA